MTPDLNWEIAGRLKEVADLLHNQGSNPFRVQAYRHAAHTLEQLDTPIDHILRSEGLEGLQKLPAIGESLSRSIKELILTGKLPMLQRLRGEVEPVTLLASIPGIGKKLADQLHHNLEIDTLEELEVAAHDGRLRQQSGIGEKRLTGIIASLAERLGRVRGKSGSQETSMPSIEEIFDVDCEYRENATPTNSISLPHVGLIQRVKPGCLSYTPSVANIITQHYIRIPPGLTKRENSRLGGSVL